MESLWVVDRDVSTYTKMNNKHIFNDTFFILIFWNDDVKGNVKGAYILNLANTLCLN